MKLSHIITPQQQHLEQQQKKRTKNYFFVSAKAKLKIIKRLDRPAGASISWSRSEFFSLLHKSTCRKRNDVPKLSQIRRCVTELHQARIILAYIFSAVDFQYSIDIEANIPPKRPGFVMNDPNRPQFRESELLVLHFNSQRLFVVEIHTIYYCPLPDM
jgi:hypothetical protein